MTLTPGATSTRGTDSHKWEMNVCNDEAAHFGPRTRGFWPLRRSGRQSLRETLSTGNEEERRASLTLVPISRIHGGKIRDSF